MVAALMAMTYLFLGVRERRVRRRQYGKAFARPPGSRWRRRLPVAIAFGAGACFAIAFAQVRLNRHVTRTTKATHGTVVLAIDTSRSMNATDVQPTRLKAAEEAAKALLEGVPSGFKVGLVTFSYVASRQVSPTANRTQLIDALGSLSISTQTGTHIGDGLSMALDTFGTPNPQSGTEHRAIVLLSDGQDMGSAVPPIDAAKRAKSLGIPVYTVALVPVGAGVPGGGAGPTLLKEVADASGGRTFTAQTAPELTQVYKVIGTRISVEVKVGSNTGIFVLAGLGLTVAAGAALVIGLRSSS